MDKKPFLPLSVHGLVDFLLRVGDIDSRVYNQETMQMGTLLHGAYQEKQGNEYLSEYPLSAVIEVESGIVALSGRADGIIVGGFHPIIDEIKSTVMPLEEFYEEQKEWHLGQALCYAYMYEKEQGGAFPTMGVQLTYLSQIDGKQKETHSFVFTKAQIEEKVEGYVREYFAFLQAHLEHIKKRNESAKALKFPYGEFRRYQRDFAALQFGLAKHGGPLFAEAPTGIGKTISALYPSVMSFADGQTERIFYLTAKNTGGMAAYEALGDLYQAGFVGFDSFLLGKEKICFCPGHACHPDDCPFAKGYYTKLKDALKEALDSGERFDQLLVSEICRKRTMCPFEFQLDLSLESDVIICDYNYFFDPMVRLERYFDEAVDASRDLVLVDEAHNLVDRGRDMYSMLLSSVDAHYARKCLKGDAYRSLRNAAKKVEDALQGVSSQEGVAMLDMPPSDLDKALESLQTATQKAMKKEPGQLPEEFRRFSRSCARYRLLRGSFYGASYRLFAVRQGEDIAMSLYCLDPSPFLSDTVRRVHAATFFSATLSPVSYYESAILGDDSAPSLLLPSPFPKENLRVLVAPRISVRYKDREASYAQVAAYLKAFAGKKIGNYFFYFPSYAYLSHIREYLDFPGCNVLTQDKNMGKEDREIFLESFAPDPKVTTIGLLTLGGAFSEGIDLVDDRLIGVAIVGVGIPQIGVENDLIRDYFETKEGKGYDFAYKFPGMNKVTQAVGRLIRSESDRGMALLIDDRYLHQDYRALIERLWPNYGIALDPKDVEKEVASFF